MMDLHQNFEEIYKLGIPGDLPARFSYGKTFARERRGETPLLCICVDGDQTELLKALMQDMPQPFWLLYILLVPRAEQTHAAGRYQSAAHLDRVETGAFLDKFKNFL